MIHFHKREGMSYTALRVRDVCSPSKELGEHGSAGSRLIKEDWRVGTIKAIVLGTTSEGNDVVATNSSLEREA